MTETIRQLVYMSKARRGLTTADVEEILAVSRANNEKRNLSGLLIYADGVFLQALEGDPEVVGEVYATIADDNRHHDATVLSDKVVDGRVFADWTMAYMESNARELAASAGIEGAMNRAELMVVLSQSDGWVIKILNSFASRFG